LDSLLFFTLFTCLPTLGAEIIIFFLSLCETLFVFSSALKRWLVDVQPVRGPCDKISCHPQYSISAIDSLLQYSLPHVETGDIQVGQTLKNLTGLV
jgi:hypothetical protein